LLFCYFLLSGILLAVCHYSISAYIFFASYTCCSESYDRVHISCRLFWSMTKCKVAKKTSEVFEFLVSTALRTLTLVLVVIILFEPTCYWSSKLNLQTSRILVRCSGVRNVINCRPGTRINFERVPGYPFKIHKSTITVIESCWSGRHLANN